MGFDLSEEQRAIRETMARFAVERLAPGAAERDRSAEFPAALVSELAALGGMAMKTSTMDEGPGADNLAYALAVEAVARADASVAVIMVASNLSAAILAANATEDQRNRFLRPVARGERGALSFGLTEPGAGSDAAAIRTTARSQGDTWIIDGTKQWITGAAGAEVFVIFAKTPEAGEGAVTCFIVEADAPGFSLGRVEDKMGLRSSGTAQLHFNGVRVPAANVVGQVGQGYRVALGALAPSRVAIAAQSLGIAERAFELGLSYAQERQVFGQPVAAFQNSRFVLADMRCALDQAWLLMLRAARLLDNGIPIRGEASMAKLVASETCGRVVDQMLQLHGGNGYSREYEIERLYRDARVMRIYEGTSEIQREVIARDLLGN
ncbi:acyl-CoA dehydrogenase [Ruegeria sp. PrR005]|uniref:Acyl-CoA dehydrogenase n=1 Tax=Ruegeria sp. PrR005 TaxID=2706882 RepID=A0A6B2NSP8_9RHOB|nr:acyl-CoA dehydrogenase [Ruegeria sp. PrR005]